MKMLYGKDDCNEYMELFLDDLSLSTQEAIIEFLGDNGNYDVFPLVRIYRGEDDINA